MNLPTIKTIEITYSWNRETDERIYHLTIVRRPLHRHVLYQMYHWYDCRIPIKASSLGGRERGRWWPRFERWLCQHGAEHMPKTFGSGHCGPWPLNWVTDKLCGWTVAQDLRCYDLSRRGVRELLEIDLNEFQYRALQVDDTPTVLLP